VNGATTTSAVIAGTESIIEGSAATKGVVTLESTTSIAAVDVMTEMGAGGS
jgi:hypothetical protein